MPDTDPRPTLTDYLATLPMAQRSEFVASAERVAESLAEMRGGAAVSLAVRTAAAAVKKAVDS